MNAVKATLKFCGGVGSVTGANFLLEIFPSPPTPLLGKERGDSEADGVRSKKILIDCGLEQGSDFADASNREPFPYDPSHIDILFITHAHADHIGRIPKLIKDGFKGVIYSTPATLDLARVMLPDTLNILEEEAKTKGVLPLYEQKDVDHALELWKSIPYYTQFDLGDGINVFLKDSGHILGSAIYEISRNGKKIAFTGDLGNSPSLFLRDTDPVTDADYMVMESVYGDRNHESKDDRKAKLADIIRDIIKHRKTLIIPAFSLERTQDILFQINELLDEKEIGELKVFIDSPLATKVTEIYKKYSKDFKESARDLIAQGDDIFNFPKLKFTLQRHESERIDTSASPKIIIAGSGMSNGGRIVRHEKHLLPDKDTILLLVGYQVLGTLGRLIQDGAKTLMIDGERVPVHAEIRTIFGYSSHKDSDHLIEFVAGGAEHLKKVFVAMGEPKSALFLAQRLRDYVGVNAIAPKKGDIVELEF